MAWIGVLIGFIVVHYAYMVSDHAVRRAYRRGCRHGIARGKLRYMEDILFMEKRANEIEEAWQHHQATYGRIDPWYRSDN